MQNILAIDTACEQCAVALSVCDRLFVLQEQDASQRSRRLLQMVEKLLVEAGISLPNVNLLAWSAGPGSFTGLRMTASFCQAVAAVHAIPVVGVSTLAMLAQQAAMSATIPDHAHIVVALDARMGEVYVGVYRKLGDGVVLQQADSLVSATPDSVSDYLSVRDDMAALYLVGDGWALSALKSLAAGCRLLPPTDTACSTASVLVALGARKWREQGDSSTGDQYIEPIYLRGASNWKKAAPPRKWLG